MNKICTSIDQSKKLIELGIDVNTADMEYMFLKKDGSKVSNVPFIKDDDEPEWPDDGSYDFIPCWSLSALLELIPTSIDEYTDDFSQLELTKQSVSYVYAMGNLRKGYLKDNLLDAVFEMICWLKENGKI